ncbi:pentatricopeptide repeat-containing protein At5g59600-like [Gastrolobium bilobum]|uniref:pentatricopeptide repeat-containing protein At5g59600-like n=1 Tax=Gastrolobium bilobum TaxID=150636 RepID=UPI002AB0522B|nr:pentatricopeptide repeat-containing protein At5g59600-like [Gastrolobium bilobum]
MKNWSFSSQLRWSPYDFALSLQKCLKTKALRPGMQVHAMLLTSGMNMNILSLSSKLVGMYASCADLKSARLLFQNIEQPNVFAFNWMVLGLAYNGYYDDALLYFRWMREIGHMGNKFTFSTVLKACVGLMDVNKGRQVHAMIFEMGFHNEVSVANALIDMYGKCGGLSHARRVFDRMPDRDVASWTSMISGFCNIGKIEQALVFFERMKLEGLEPNYFTWNAIISAYARSRDSNKAFAFIERMKKEGFVLDLVAWNALISGFVQNDLVREAFKLFQQMLLSRIEPNQVTIAALLPACGSTGSIKGGREIHGFICRKGFDVNVFIASALIDMYSKCGSSKDARNVFDKIPCKNVASWNAMIDCYGKCGMVDSSMELFKKMYEEGLQPNEVTFTCILSACSHSGSVQKGLEIFISMKECYGIEISMQHYACVVDLLCRSGKTVEAYEFLKAMPIQVTESIAGAFLHACRVHGRRDLAKMMAEEIMRMQFKGPGGFVTLSNIYAADGDWEEVGNVRKEMKERNVHKWPGSSWLEKQSEILEGKKDKVGNNMAS